MLSLQEITSNDAIKQQLKEIQATMDATGSFHPEAVSPHTHEPIGLSHISDYTLRAKIMETLHSIPLREFLAKSGTTGIAGAAYLVPDKIHSDLVMYGHNKDVCPLIGSVVDGWKGGDLKVNIVDKATYQARKSSSGGSKATSTVQTVQATLAPETFDVPILITKDLLEDDAYDLLDFHIRAAAEAVGEKASDMALTVLATATDGWGTLNGGASGDADETRWEGATTEDVNDCIQALTDDRWIANTLVATSEAWEHSIQTTLGIEVGGGAAGDYWRPRAPYNIIQYPTLASGFDMKIGNIDVLLINSPCLHNAGELKGTAMTNCISLVFDRNAALLTGRKRWMQINNYADPVRDLDGAIVTCRQDSVTLYDDAIAKITET